MAHPIDPSMTVARQRTFLGHPVGLFVLFFTEMWERFNYYGMRALLMLYMLNALLMTQANAANVSKWYTSLTYLTPLIGGFLADKFLGNKWAIVIGATLMAFGQLTLAFGGVSVFYMALVLLIIGNGFFKPNMSTQVGRLYAVGDPRRDGAYTIFYMGINLGAFIAPIVCGSLRVTPGFGFSWGFAAAGVGMLIGLAIYLFGLPLIQELPPGTIYQGPGSENKKSGAKGGALTEQQAAETPSVVGALAAAAPVLLIVLGFVAMIGAVVMWKVLDIITWDSAFGLGAGGGLSAFITAWVISKLRNALRDRVLAILLLAFFVICFWGAFEQASNAMNVFADKVTNRYVTEAPPTPSPYPVNVDEAVGEMSVGERIARAFTGLVRINPVATESFQSINPFAIFILAPLFAWLWTALPRWGIDLSIPAKMSIGVFLEGLGFALLIWSVRFENQPSETKLDALPQGVYQNAEGQVVFRDAPNLSADDAAVAEFAKPVKNGQEGAIVAGGRLRYESAADKLTMTGVLADTDRERLWRASVSADYVGAIRELAKRSEESEKAARAANAKEFSASVKLEHLPAGFDLRYTGLARDKVDFNESTGELTVRMALTDPDYKRLLQAGADPKFRDATNDLFVKSSKFKVSVWWLFWFYILCTLGELCLSPVGLSMVSKLAPAGYATMLMGMWHLTSFFGNFLAGLAGESWGTVHPFNYFVVITAVLMAASVICFIVSRFIVKLMHGAK